MIINGNMINVNADVLEMLTPGDAISINECLISGTYQGNDGILVSGNIVSLDLIAGPGIIICGNQIMVDPDLLSCCDHEDTCIPLPTPEPTPHPTPPIAPTPTPATRPSICGTSASASASMTSGDVQCDSYDFGAWVGKVSIDYEMLSCPDKLVVKLNGSEVINTGFVPHSGIVTFDYPGNQPVEICVTGGECDGKTAWKYDILCED